MGDSKEMDNIDEKSKLNTENDSAKIKFQSSKNGEAKIDLPDSGSVGYQCGLTKEDLMKYANDPFWIAMRRILFVLFWLLWIAMLVGAVAIIITTPSCAAPKEPEWYESSPMYELRVDEFYSKGDNQKPDLSGIKEKLPYFDEISVSAIVIDGLFNKDNPKDIEPSLGSFIEFKEISERVKLLIKIRVSQIDLSSEQKQMQFVDTLRFWLDKNAAGFVFDEIELLPTNLDLKKLTEQWHGVISNFSSENFPRVSILSSYKPLEENEFCRYAHMILNYKPTELTKGFTPQQLVDIFEPTVEENRTTSCRFNLVLSNGDIQPLLNRFGSEERDRLILFTLLADATPFIYFGEEYANSDSDMPPTLTRNHGHTPLPMKWNIIDAMKPKSNNFYNVFVKGAKLRKSEYAIRMGDTSLKIIGENVVAMSRIKKGNPGFAVVTNFGNSSQVDLSLLGNHIPETGHIEIVSSISEKPRGKVQLKELEIAPLETLVVQFVPIL
ncbi:4F2 cell-surface antigen heavy chain-like [Tropilaelaps mercedesae]|uniref:4F2 cell-surface antigen heavy chain-like n=1 Tax=Tropilaelaps mercedesae TaxID=418985 RepID=A0A1V9X4G8_9ACAR|nr:4F2 cell-surface antigen heavy chain-like [Tropilaelaps mercedesae]